ncbi:hypothetical protein B4U80_05042, partial [Leptotrombidium deliense]
FLVHGREAILPADVTLGLPGQQATNDVDEYVQQLTENLQTAKQMVEANIEAAQSRYKNNYYKHRSDKEFEKGDTVLVYTPKRVVGKAEKLMHNFYGPYQVIEKLSPLVYKVINKNTRKCDTVNIARMKKFNEREDPFVVTETNYDISFNEIPENVSSDISKSYASENTSSETEIDSYYTEHETDANAVLTYNSDINDSNDIQDISNIHTTSNETTAEGKKYQANHERVLQSGEGTSCHQRDTLSQSDSNSVDIDFRELFLNDSSEE